ncbi:MAG TPA: peptidoglycan-binding protein [Methylomirabilota bacterium]|jgi:peptidoglycan hydrolase-like protein with peptidoglycan-binding domain
MKKIAMIAFALALGLSWSGVAIPADVKEETKEKARDAGETTKEKLKDAGEATKEKSKEVGEKIKETGEKAKDKTVEIKDKTKEKIVGDKDGMDKSGHSVKVRTAQQALVDKGYNPGPVDGLMGPKTRAAVQEFQGKEGLEANGQLDMKTMSRLGASKTSSSSPSASPATEPQAASATK